MKKIQERIALFQKTLDLGKQALPPVIDHHGHLGISRLSTFMPDQEAAEILAAMDDTGVDACVAFYSGDNYRSGNSIALEGAAKLPERLFVYAYLNHDTSKAMLAEMERCRKAGAVGLKLHSSWSGAAFTHRDWLPVWDYCASHNWPVIIHGMEPQLAKDHPKTIFIHAHGISCIYDNEVVEATRRCSNYYWDTSATMTRLGAIEDAVRLFGAERLIFGSDFPLNNMATRLGAVLTARISENDLCKILAGNIADLLSINLKNLTAARRKP